MPEIGDSLRLCGITVLDISANGGTGPYSKSFTPTGRQPRSFRYHKRGRVARSVTSRIEGRDTAVSDGRQDEQPSVSKRNMPVER